MEANQSSAQASAADLATVFRTEERAVTILDAAQQVHAATVHHVLAPVPRRHTAETGRAASIVLVGDAAHPAGAGQGASMAFDSGSTGPAWM